jgi:RNA polymerase sigma factor (sigma-70 family)
MYLPPGITEEYFFKVADRVCKIVSATYKFGYHDSDDMYQQAMEEAIKGMRKYDPSRPLENFLFVHVRHRMNNYLRDHFQRSENPCAKCTHPETERDLCPRFLAWEKLNGAKKNIMQPNNIYNISDEGEPSMSSGDTVTAEANFNELNVKIDRQLNPALRADYKRILSGCAVPKARRLEVQKAVAEILGVEHGPIQ